MQLMKKAESIDEMSFRVLEEHEDHFLTMSDNCTSIFPQNLKSIIAQLDTDQNWSSLDSRLILVTDLIFFNDKDVMVKIL